MGVVDWDEASMRYQWMLNSGTVAVNVLESYRDDVAVHARFDGISIGATVVRIRWIGPEPGSIPMQ